MYRKYVKRLMDLIFALVLIVLLWPLMVMLAILIKAEDPTGPAIFKQERVGQGNKSFKVLKFRSMITETEKNGRKLADAERMLKTGRLIRKLSLDELPQLFNIVKGEMSFIGPRPLPTIYLPYYTEEELKRHDVKPGISGWAQVNGRNYLSWEQKFKYDLHYVNNLSFLLDLKISFLTIAKIIARSDVGVRGQDFPDVSLHEIRSIRQTFKM